LGEENGAVADAGAGRVAEFYEAKLQRSLDRIVGKSGAGGDHRIRLSSAAHRFVMTSLLSASARIVG